MSDVTTGKPHIHATPYISVDYSGKEPQTVVFYGKSIDQYVSVTPATGEVILKNVDVDEAAQIFWDRVRDVMNLYK